MNKKWIFFLVVISFIIYSFAAQAALTKFDNSNMPTKTVEIANLRLPTNKIALPDWNQISLAQLPGISNSGMIDGSPYSQILGYDLSRTWIEGMTPDEYLKLGDISEALQAEKFSLQAIGDISNVDVNKVPLNDFPLIKQQSLSHLSQIIPRLYQTKIRDIAPINALLKAKGIEASNLTLAQAVATYPIGQMQLGEINLDKFSITSIPNLEVVPIQDFEKWMNSFVKDIPGLGQVPLGLMPNPVTEIGNLVMRIDGIYGKAENHRKNTISGSDVQGFSVPCSQKDCAYIELDDLENVGKSDRSSLEGKQWISGKYQEVEGGKGILKAVNNGREPTGRFPYGKAFKVVVIEPSETTDTVETALYFRFCAWRMGCTPYFIGPVPFFSYKVNALMFVGNLDSGNEQASNITSTSTNATKEIKNNTTVNNEATNQFHPCTFTNINRPIISKLLNGINLQLLGDVLAELTQGITNNKKNSQENYQNVGLYTCVAQSTDCGRALGRYQLMSYNPSVVRSIITKPEGKSFLERVKQGYKPNKDEIFKFFPPADQDAVFIAEIANKIKVTQTEIDPTTRLAFNDERLIARVAQKYFGGDLSKIDEANKDVFDRLSIKQYSEAVVARYRNLNRYDETLTCNPNVNYYDDNMKN